MTDKPIAQWAIDEARRRSGYHVDKSIPTPPIRELAIMIERHEQPPGTSELLAARDYAAMAYHGVSVANRQIQEGELDDLQTIKAFLAGVTWARENEQ